MNKHHQSYRERLGYKEDFKVSYKFRSEKEGGRKLLPNQGIRFDFWYENQDNKEGEVFAIWPEFENSEGEVLEMGQPSNDGIARMWIINYEIRKYHQSRIRTGIKCFFMEGSRMVADCEVIEIVDLMINQTNEEN